MTIQSYGLQWLESVRASRSVNTAETYANALKAFYETLRRVGIKPSSPPSRLTERIMTAFIEDLHSHSISTERVYISALRRFMRFLNAEEATALNLEKIDSLIRDRSRRAGVRLIKFSETKLEGVIAGLGKLPHSPTRSIRLRQLRDIALVLTLADSGLRIHEACHLKRGDIDLGSERIKIIGKGDKEAVVYLTKRARLALSRYLQERAELDGASGQPLGSLPLFSRHDKAAGRKILPITTKTGRKIIAGIAISTIGEAVTPHKFRHLFVTKAYRSGGIAFAQRAARHSSMQMTDRYTHLSDKEMQDEYQKAFEH